LFEQWSPILGTVCLLKFAGSCIGGG
jgi:hypothetical protein